MPNKFNALNKVFYSTTIARLSLLLPFLFLGISGLFSQRIVEVKYQQDSRGIASFTAFNHAYCNYILEVHFTTFDNVKSDQPLPYRAEIKPGLNKLFSISAVNPNVPIKFNYASSYNKGCILPNVDTGFIYLLPISAGKEAQAYVLGAEKPADQSAPQNNWYVIRVRMKPGDTIYASRRGVVTEVEDNDATNDAGLPSAGHENYIEVVHADCSFGHYGILKKASSLVKPGQLVRPGQPIGLVGGDKFGRGSEARFSVYYNQEVNVSQNGENIWKMVMIYVPIPFWTKNNGRTMLKNGAEYVSEYPLTILNRELPRGLGGKKVKSKK